MSCTGGGTRDGTTNLTTLTWYEGTGAAIRTTTDAGVSSATTATTDTAYDALGRTQATRDALGTVTRTTYASATGKVATVVVNCVDASPPANWWDCTGTATANGTRNLVTSYAYDARGNTVTAIVPNGRRTTTSYDLADRVIKVVDNDVATPMLPSDDVTTETAYDAAGRQIASKSPTADGSSSVVTTTTYDPNGHLASTIANCTVSGTTPPGDPAWRTCGQGGITGTADRVTNVVTTYGYDTRGNQVAVTAPDPSAGADALTTATTRSAYDTEGQLCRVLAAANVDLQGLTDPCTTPVAGTTTTNLSTLYGYDAVGNLSSMVDSDGNTTTYLFDATTGLPTGTTDGTNHATSIAYDPLGRKATETDRAGHAVTYAYDAAGRVLTRTAGGATTAYAYDLAGNRLAASAGSPVVTISTAYDALGRPLSVSTSGDAAATTTYSYSLTSPSWTDPTGTYTASLDAFNRQVSLDDSVTTGVSATAYRADGQVASVTRPGSPPIPTTYTYDAAGRPTGSATGVVASFSYVLNRADTRLSEAATVTGDANNGTAYFAYDRLGRLTSYTPPGGAPVPFGWDKVPNRTSAYGVTTTFDAANRPTGTGWSADLDGRIGTIPSPPEPSAVTGITYDALGRLTGATMGGVATTYTYDALDRLSTVTRGGTATERFRYVGQTTAVAQILNGAGVVVKNIANDWAGARFADWLTGTSDLRFFGTNGHGDTVYTLNAGGSVTERNRLDPWGVPLSAPSGTFPEFRFQGSWYDAGTDLAWAIARWYAPRLGTFTSEDSVVGSPADPPSRHLYAFGEGDPVGRVDTGGQFWYRTVKSGKTLPSIADKYLPGTWGAWPMIVNANRSNGRIPSNFKVPKGTCLWIPLAWIAWGVDHHKNLGCDYGTSPFSYQRATKQNKEWWVPDASETLYLWKSGGFLNLTRELLYAKTAKIANRPRIIFQPESGSSDMDVFDWIAKAWIKSYGGTIHRFHDPGAIFSPLPNVRLVYGNSVWPSAFRPAFAFTMGYYMFIDRHKFPKAIPTWLVSHEYVHVLEYEGKGLGILDYMFDPNRGSPKQEYEAIAYLWQGWTKAYGEASYDAFEPPAP
jgi:RHS repeat-associated protein